MRLLLLGGTAMLGRAIAVHARDSGHDVTCLARGTGAVPDGVEFVVGDQDADGLAPVRDRTWDAVVDLARQPGHVRRAALQIRTGHRVFVSSVNVYARFDRLEQDEAAPVREPLAGDTMADSSEYGEAKVACEQAVRAASGTATVIRPGLIGGAGDTTSRSGYYPWRFAHPTGGDVLVPDDLDFPLGMIDVDDLAAWIVLVAADRVDGTFNAAGPTTTLGAYLDLARAAAGPAAPPARPVPLDVLRREEVNPWMGPRSLPLWGVEDPDWRYFATWDTTAARAAGLVTRPLDQTVAAGLAFENIRSDDRQSGLTDAEEIALRDALA